MNTGWRAISASGRPGRAALGNGSGGKSMNDITASDASATPTSAAYAPANGTGNASRVTFARFGPITAPMIPPASTHEIARSLNSRLTSSVAAKRYSPALAL